jgi:hypothetical protein
MLRERLYQTPQVNSLNFGPWSESQVLSALRQTDFNEVNDLPLPTVPVYFFIGGKFEVPLKGEARISTKKISLS